MSHIIDLNKRFLGVVEDNKDPNKLGRARIRVFDVFDSIPAEDIPWATPHKDNNGNSINVPDVGKIVSVVFDSGNIYTPEFIWAQHHNVNLKKKLSELSEADYVSMKALLFDHKTQIYVNDSEGLKLDYKFNMLNIKETSINLDLKDNFSSLNLGCDVASQRSILGDHFLNWFDDFVNQLLSGPYLGNLGSAVVANPSFIQTLLKYQALKEPKFLSHHVNIVDNDSVDKLDRVADGQIGDSIKTSKKELQKEVFEPKQKSEPVSYKPQSGLSTDSPSGAPLTTKVNTDGTTQPNNTNIEDLKIIPSTHDDINKIIDAMTKNNYIIYTKPFEMNVVGIRRQYEGMVYSNSHIDHLYLIYKDETNSWAKSGPYAVSTIPGTGIRN